MCIVQIGHVHFDDDVSKVFTKYKFLEITIAKMGKRLNLEKL